MDEALKRRRHFRNRPRSERRINVTWRVADEGGAGEHSDHTRDVSIGGAFIVTGEPAARGTPVKVTLALGPDTRLTVDAEVRWVASGDDEERGMGVRFQGLSIEQAQALGIWLASVIDTVDHDDLA
jgi:uncharacterized protein (TIGR02266 family)